MKKIYTGIAFIITIIVLEVSCGTSLKVISNYDKNANFRQYKTFVIDPVRINESMSQEDINRITNAVKADLVRKGFVENTSAPDLKITAAAIIKDKQAGTANANASSYRPREWDESVGATGYTTYNLQNYKDGSLLIDIADAKTNKLVWEGIGNKQVNKPSKDPDREIPAIVTSVMAGFPPKEK